ncbi:MAG TPA: methionyl-tRNA formyltransferase [Acidimicrobiales bacterium]|nr:methionyl-tRNA formyltransferase [Acidimicrobiales bacterium]
MTLPLPDRPHRLVYLGTPELAVAPLHALVEAGYEVPLVVTRADKRRGRRGAAEPSPVKAAAAALGLASTTDVDEALTVGAELGVVVAFGRLIKPHVLAALPMVNLHFSLLPRWRGAAPVERALLAGDEVTGVCLMDVVDELDAGDVFARREVPIGPRSTLEELRVELVDAGISLLLDGLTEGFAPPAPQRGEVTYADKLTADDFHLDWRRPANEVDRVVRVGNAWTTAGGRRLKVLAARPTSGGGGPTRPPGTVDGTVVACGDGSLELVEVQPEGKRPMAAADWRRGHPGEVVLGG